MKQVLLNGFLFLDVPEEAKDFVVNVIKDESHLYYNIGEFLKPNFKYTKLPPGSYQIVSLADSLTEDQWKQIMDEECFADDSVMYVDYNDDDLFFKTALESGQSFLKANNLSNALILKKIL